VTGLGIITAYGAGTDKNAAAFSRGDRAFGPATLFDTSRQRVKTAAEAPLPSSIPCGRLTFRRRSRLERAAKLLFVAADEALRTAGWNGSDEPTPVVLGTTSGGMNCGEEYFRHAIQHPAGNRRQPTRVSYYLAQRQALDLAEAHGLSGPLTIIANACAAGANAIGHAYDLVRGGQAARAMAGGYDALSHLVFSGFDVLQALSPAQCRPFDAHRDGLALGEGAAVLTLERLENALARGAKILCEIAGYGASTDSHHLTQPQPQGEAALRSMQAACRAANVDAREILYLNAHGTGTPLNDSAETAAINRWAGADAEKLWVSSTKSGVGHLLGAAGAVESAVCIMALKGQWLPPMPPTSQADPTIRFNLVRQTTKAADLRRPFDYALSNSFGFGGANASLIFRRFR
jgi:3-oxoacyl-[acyl-carrier-protein] synthase II